MISSKSFSSLPWKEKLKVIQKISGLSDEDITLLRKNIGHRIDIIDALIENGFSFFPLPMGLLLNFKVNESIYNVPMAVEETSVVAAVNRINKWITSSEGHIHSTQLGKQIIGQIQIPILKQQQKFREWLAEAKSRLIHLANQGPAHSMWKRGGGVQDIYLREIQRPDLEMMGIIHVTADVQDAMGANVVNQICEFLRPIIEHETNEEILMCILSNLNVHKTTRVEILLKNVEVGLSEKIEEASLFAQIDPFRAATNNKGMMNGIDSVLISTGNDWRAVEAGLHAYAAKDGKYQSLSKWKRDGNDLIGTFEGPINVGIVGGVTKIHPMAQLSLKLMHIKSAEELSQVVGAVGLVQNLAALRALVMEGITKGHMKLHIKNLLLLTDGNEEEKQLLEKRLSDLLEERKYILASDAHQLLKEIRAGK